MSQIIRAFPAGSQASGPPQDAVKFLEFLDPTTDEFTFQVFDDNADRKNKNLIRVLHGTLAKHYPTLKRLSEQGGGVFVTVNATTLQGARNAGNITRVRHVFVDLDGSPLQAVLDWEEKKPHAIVESSPDRWHAYYTVKDFPLDGALFGRAQTFLIEKFGGDKSVIDLPRVLRVPGFLHQKVRGGVVSPPFVSRLYSVLDHPPYPGSAVDLAPDNPFLRPTILPKRKDKPLDVDEFRRALLAIPADEYKIWWECGCAIFTELGVEDGGELFHEWSATSGKYSVAVTQEKWEEICGSSRKEITRKTVFKIANEISPDWGKTSEDGLPVIRIKAGQQHETVKSAERLLLDSEEDELYQRGSMLVRPVPIVTDAAHRRKTTVVQLVEVIPRYVTDRLGPLAVWLKFNELKGKWAAIDPPDYVATGILSKFGHWTFPIIRGVITTPTMRPDGSLLTTPGYDVATQLLLVKPPPMPPMPDNPTKEDALEALDLLEGLLAEFPFVDEPSMSVALSGLITPVVRGAFAQAPLHFSDAPKAGTGKSYVWDIVASIAIGDHMPVVAAEQDQKEMGKRLDAALMTGQPLISLDNVDGELRSATLCQVLTQDAVDIRILGLSKQLKVESGSVTMYGTGNNVAIAGDLCRRTLMARLDSKLEKPELRSFEKKPVALVLENRGKYVAAVLTICRAYILAGYPGKARPLGSFEGWSDVVRSALIWLGKADPVLTIETAQGEDPDRAELESVLVEWSTVLGVGRGQRRTLVEVLKIASEGIDVQFGAARWPDLHAAIAAICEQRGRLDPKRFGLWAQRKKRVPVGGMRLMNEPNSHGAKWWVEEGTQNQPGTWTPETTVQVQNPSRRNT